MKKRTIYIIIAVVVVIVVAIGGYFVINSNNINKMNAPSNNGSNSQTITPGTVSMHNFAFDPATITVNKGDTVIWQNNDSVTHHVAADDGSFDLGGQSGGVTVKFTFTKTGMFNYHCTIHTAMAGVVIVK